MKLTPWHKIFSSFFTIGLIFTACGNNSDQEDSNKIEVVTSFYPIAEFAKMVGGDKIEVSVLAPIGVEPHDYELSPKDLELIESSDLLIVQGAGMEAWFDEDLEEDLVQKGVYVLIISEHLTLVEGDDEHDEHEKDPHTWLSPLMAIETVKMIEMQLIQLDPENEADYKTLAEKSIEDLENLHARFLGQLNSCEQRVILTSHDAFSYLGELYGIEIMSIHGISTEDEPSAQDLSELISESTAHQLKYLLVEPGVSSDFSETVSEEAQLKTLILDTLESPTGETGSTYIEIMDYNLQTLKEAMQCQ